MSEKTALGNKFNEFLTLLLLAQLRVQNIVVRDSDFNFNEMMFLEFIYRFPENSQKTISRFLGLSFSSISDIADKLERLGLVNTNPKEGRRRKYFLTENGQVSLCEIRHEYSYGVGQIFSDKLDHDEQITTLNLLNKLLGQKDIMNHPKMSTDFGLGGSEVL